MKKLIKYLLITLILLVVLIAAAIMAIVNFINPNDYRDKISQMASTSLKQTVIIHGDLNWQFIPSFGLVIHDVTIGDQQSGASWHASLNKAKVGVYLWPLLNKHLSMKELSLEGLNLELTDVTGSTNPSSNTEMAVAPGALSNKLLDNFNHFDLKTLKISQANVIVHHQLTQTTSNVNDINFSATDIGANKTTDFRLHLTYLPDDKQSKEPTDFSWSGHLKIDTDQQQVDCTDCHLEMNETLANGQKIPFDATSDIHYQLNDQSLSAPSIKGTLDDVQFTAQLAAKSLKENPDVNFSFTANTEHLSAILKKWGFAIKTQNPQTLQNFSLSGTGQLHNKQLDIPTIKLKVDSSTLSGSVQSADISHRAFNAQFSLDNLDIGAYLPPAKPNKLLQLKELTGSFKILLPLEQQSLAISGPLKFTTLTTDTFAISQFSTLLDMKDGFIALSKSQADLLGGHYQGSSQIDLSGSNPKFVSNQTFTNIQIEPLVRLLDPKLQLSGLANISGSINSIGATLPLIKQNLNGNLKLSIKHGVLHGINIQQWINTAGALVQQKPLADTPSDNSTDFGDLSASMSINSGVINNQDLVMNMPFAHATGRGTIDLAGEQLDYHLLISQIRHLSRIDSVPLSISGSFANPHIQLDKNALFQQVANKQFTGQKGRLADRLTQRRGNKEIDQTINKLIQRVDINKLLGH